MIILIFEIKYAKTPTVISKDIIVNKTSTEVTPAVPISITSAKAQ